MRIQRVHVKGMWKFNVPRVYSATTGASNGETDPDEEMEDLFY
jgi:hypothetical protein